MQLVQQQGIGKLAQGLLTNVGGTDYACFQINKTAGISISTLVVRVGMLGHINEDLVWVLVCGSHDDGDNGRLRV
jgi:hypothetical protein